MSQIPDLRFEVGSIAKVRTDAVSDTFVDLSKHDGIGSAPMGRDWNRTMGLSVI